MSVTLQQNEWLLAVSNGQAVLWKDSEARAKWDIGRSRCYKWNVGEEQVKILSCHGNQLICDTVEVIGNAVEAESVLEVDFTISSFEVLWPIGVVLCCDAIGGVVHAFDTLKGRYMGFVRIDGLQTDIYSSDDSQFQLFANRFDTETLTSSLYLNTYGVDDKRDGIILRHSVSVENPLPMQRIVRDTRISHYILVSTCTASRISFIQLFLPAATKPFHQKCFYDEVVQDCKFMEPYKLAIATTDGSVVVYDVLREGIVFSTALCTENVSTFCKRTANGTFSSFAASDMPFYMLPQEIHQERSVAILRADAKSVYLVDSSMPRVVFHWNMEHLKAMIMQEPVLAVADLGYVCVNSICPLRD